MKKIFILLVLLAGLIYGQNTPITLTTPTMSNTHDFRIKNDFIKLCILQAVATDTFFIYTGSGPYLSATAVKSYISPAEWDSVITGITATNTEATNRMFLIFAPGGTKYLKVQKGYSLTAQKYILLSPTQ